ncbi:hypothetical protein NMY22_g7201 [Coprinellus aureogranulatus]|nr:hypothetical protein NMY22_g7201 [Coprinellus aureogranulatus]
MAATSLDEIVSIHATLNNTFLAATSSPALASKLPVESNSPHPLLSFPYRAHQLRQVARLVQSNADAFCEAIAKDFGKPRQEIILAEVGGIIEKALISVKELEKWVGGEDGFESVKTVGWQANWKAGLERKAKGVVFIISPWNYPLVLTFQPLLGAIAAGCPAVVKPSELVPNFSALVADLVPKYLDPAAYRVILGGIPETTKALELKWDHIFYTGNGRVARIICAAAAKHLTPTTLELGGKSPIIIDPETCGDMDIVAKRILWGKINNSGQICVAPDYVLIPKTHIDVFIASAKRALGEFFPNGSALDSSDYGRIVTDLHFKRVTGLLSKTKGQIVAGGKTGKGGQVAKDRGVEPTIVKVKQGDVLLDEELFAPILPVVDGIESLDDALAYVRKRDHPLILYAFTQDKAVQDKIRKCTMSGGLGFNDTFQQLSVNELPFGGVGESGTAVKD